MPLRKLVTSPLKSKLLRRYIISANYLIARIGTCDVDKIKIGELPEKNRKDTISNIDSLMKSKKGLTELKVELPTEKQCADVQASLKQFAKNSKEVVTCTDKEAKLIKGEEYKKLIIEVYERLDVKGPLKFQSQIVDASGNRLHDIFVRSKSEYISLNHFGKSAIDHFNKVSEWPKKLGITIPTK